MSTERGVIDRERSNRQRANGSQSIGLASERIRNLVCGVSFTCHEQIRDLALGSWESESPAIGPDYGLVPTFPTPVPVLVVGDQLHHIRLTWLWLLPLLLPINP